MLGRQIADRSTPPVDNLLTDEVKQLLIGDVVTGNLECVLGSVGKANRNSHSHFRGDFERSETFLRRFHVLSLANNHINDFGTDAIEETVRLLDSAGILHVGIAKDPVEASQPAIIEIGGVEVAVFGATTVSPLERKSPFRLATLDRTLFDEVTRHKRRGAICIVHLHAGAADLSVPAPTVKEKISEFVQCQPDVVFGHHPHNLQGSEQISRTHIWYSLGDFIFDRFEHGRDRALVAHANFDSDKQLCLVKQHPIKRNLDLTLAVLTGDELEQANADFDRLCSEIIDGSYKYRFYAQYGNPLNRLTADLIKDFNAGGLNAVYSKIKRLNSSKIKLLFTSLSRFLRQRLNR